MLGNFKKLLLESEKPTKVPDGILAVLNKALPKGFEYKAHGEECIIEPINKDDISRIKFNFKMPLSKALLEKHKDNFEDYLYRTQTTLLLEDLKFKIDDKVYNINDFIKNPLKLENYNRINCYLRPPEFPPARLLKFKVYNGKTYAINFRRKPYNDMNIMLISNEDFNVLNIHFYVDEKNENMTMKLKIDFEAAESIAQLIEAFVLYRGFISGNVKLNDSNFPEWTYDGISEEQVTKAITCWTKVNKLEKILQVQFKPTKDLTELEYRYVQELYTCLIEKKPILTYEPFDHLYFGSIDLENTEDLVDKHDLSFSFIEEFEFNIIEHKFAIYSTTIVDDFIVTSINNIEEENKMKINIVSEEHKKSKLTQFYFLTKDQAEQYMYNYSKNN